MRDFPSGKASGPWHGPGLQQSPAASAGRQELCAGEGSGAATASLHTSRCRGRKCNRLESWRGLDPAAAGSAEVRSRDVLLRDAAW